MMPCTGVVDEAVRAANHSLRAISQENALREIMNPTACSGATAENLAELRHFVVSIQHLVVGATGLLESCEPRDPLDPDGHIAVIFEAAEQIIEEAVEEMDRRSGTAGAEQSALRSPTLGEPITKAFSSTVNSLRRLHDATVRLRWAILEHDADLSEPSGKVYDASGIEELIADLHS